MSTEQNRPSNRKLFRASILVPVFFVVVILMYFIRLHAAEKDNIIRHGELSTVKTAQQIELCLTSGMDTLRLAGTTVESMRDNGCDGEMVLDYLRNESKISREALDEGFTGIYGYIDGHYYDGADWQPPDGYDAQKRPWYKAAVAAQGDVILVDPYLDLNTGKNMLTIAQTLKDGKSVLAMDIGLDRIQRITDEAASHHDRMSVIVFDSQGNIAALSDGDNANFMSQTGLVNMVYRQQIYLNNADYFQLRYNQTDYIVYKVQIKNGWYSVSVIDATEVFRPLRLLLIVTVAALIASVVILTIVFLKSNQKSVVADQLNEQISTLANIYISIHELDLEHDTYTEILTSNPFITEVAGVSGESLQETFNRAIDKLSNYVSRSKMREFIDLSTLEERLNESVTITESFFSYRKIWCQARFVVSARDAQGHITRLIFMVENIDEEKRKRDKLRKRSERAIAASEAKSAFLSSMSHEIRTPITAVLGMNEMIRRESKDENILKYAENINAAGNTLLSIINDILDFSKIEAGKIDILPVEYDLASVINDLVNMIHTRADDKGLVLTVDCDRTIPSILYGDEIRIKQVITNLLTNAVKYTERGTVSLIIHHHVALDDPKYIYLEVKVRDTGIGIPRDRIADLFHAFERIDEEQNRGIEGTGLGLNITQQLLHLMGSNLEVESEYGKGSEFSFTLRQRIVKNEPLGDYEKNYQQHAPGKERYQARFTAPDAKLLVVDDNSMNLMVFQSLLKQTEVQITPAESGAACLALAAKEKYDIIFLDHMMPHKDGMETLADLKKMADCPNLDTPVVSLTANAVSGARETYLAAGFTDYLTKPIDPAKLEEMLEQYLPPEKLRRAGEEVQKVQEIQKNDKIPAFLYDMKELDIDKGLSYCGDEMLYLDMLRTYAQMIGEEIAAIRELWEKRDIQNLTIKVHGLKSNLRLIGASDLGEKAYALELAGKAGNTGAFETNLEPLMQESTALGEKLAKLERRSS